MKLANLVKYSLLLCLVAVLALTGASPLPQVGDPTTFSLLSLKGRFISAENAFDVSTSHSAGGGNVGPPVFFSAAAVMVADGHGKVCGESDGFYGGTPPPGVNLGPNLFHGTFMVEAVTGRVTINTVNDGAPTSTNVFCGTTTPINTTGAFNFKTQVGYLQDFQAERLSTVEQINASDSSKPGGCCAVSGFLVHHRNWIRD